MKIVENFITKTNIIILLTYVIFNIINLTVCRNYEKGFCRLGPDCDKLHIEKTLCEDYSYGFCPLGPRCIKAHPKLLSSIDNNFLRLWNRHYILPK